MTLEDDLGYNLAEHLKKLKQTCRVLISDHQKDETIEEAIEKLQWLERAEASKMIDEAYKNCLRQDQSPVEYLRLSVYALEQDVWEMYSNLESNAKEEIDFFKEF